jgi:serine protease Do
MNYKIAGAAVLCFAFSLKGIAQVAPEPPVPAPPDEVVADSNGNQSELIIRPKGDKDSKVTIEIRDGDFYVNGKPLGKFEDQNIEIEKRKLNDNEDGFSYAPSPFRENFWDQERFQKDLQRSLNNLYKQRNLFGYNSNEAFLGVASRKAETGGATILEVTPASPAEKAGLKKGDVIIKVNDEKIESPGNLSETVHQYKPGEKVKITFKRGGKEQSVSAVLEKSKAGHGIYNYKYEYRSPDMPYLRGPESMPWGSAPPKIGLKVQDSEEGKGVNVLEVTDASAAEKAGLKKGDLITSFDGTEVNSADELVQQLREARNKSAVKVKILRNGKQQELEVRIPRKLRTEEL